jgi:sugar/nucleoside kinase (ribokinase family)
MYDITVLGNSPVDILTHVKEDFLQKYSLNKADFNPVDAETFTKISEECTFEGMEAGGSCANTAWALGKMNKNIHFIGHVGQDPAGKHFFHEMQNAGVSMLEPQKGSRTMEIFVLITPDGERTFVSRGVTAFITPEMLQKETFDKSNWLFIEGYTLLDQTDAVLKSIKLAQTSNCKIAFTISADFIIHAQHEVMFESILPNLDLFIANDEEHKLLQEYIAKLPEDKKAHILHKLKSIQLLITHNEKGAEFINKGQKTFLPTEPKKVLDATGAGDAFAAGFLAKFLENDTSGGLTLGHLMAGEVISQLGGRLKDWSKIPSHTIQKSA